jgi:hypothetical protein
MFAVQVTPIESKVAASARSRQSAACELNMAAWTVLAASVLVACLQAAENT